MKLDSKIHHKESVNIVLTDSKGKRKTGKSLIERFISKL
jgi:hypothetical protein